MACAACLCRGGPCPTVRVPKSRNTLTRCRPWSQVIRFQGLSETSVRGRPSSGSRHAWHGSGMTDALWPHGSTAELVCATCLSHPARPVSDQRHFAALPSTLSRDTTHDIVIGLFVNRYAFGLLV